MVTTWLIPRLITLFDRQKRSKLPASFLCRRHKRRPQNVTTKLLRCHSIRLRHDFFVFYGQIWKTCHKQILRIDHRIQCIILRLIHHGIQHSQTGFSLHIISIDGKHRAVSCAASPDDCGHIFIVQIHGRFFLRRDKPDHIRLCSG